MTPPSKVDTYEKNAMLGAHQKRAITWHKLKRMDQIKAILRSYQSTRSLKQTARQLKISKKTVKTYIRRAEAFSDDMGELLKRGDDELRQIIYPTGKQEDQSREMTFISKIDYWLKELKRPGVTRQLLWEEYISDHRDGYQYSQFCERLKQAIDRKDLTLMLSLTMLSRLGFVALSFPFASSVSSSSLSNSSSSLLQLSQAA